MNKVFASPRDPQNATVAQHATTPVQRAQVESAADGLLFGERKQDINKQIPIGYKAYFNP